MTSTDTPPPVGAVTTAYLAMRANHPCEDTISAAQNAAQRLDRARRLLPITPARAPDAPSQGFYVPPEIVAEMAEGAELAGSYRVAAGWREVAAEMRLGSLKV